MSESDNPSGVHSQTGKRDPEWQRIMRSWSVRTRSQGSRRILSSTAKV